MLPHRPSLLGCPPTPYPLQSPLADPHERTGQARSGLLIALLVNAWVCVVPLLGAARTAVQPPAAVAPRRTQATTAGPPLVIGREPGHLRASC